MTIIGCDYHPGFQQIVFVDTKTGEWKEQRLEHREPAEKFYRELASRREKMRVGMEASGHARWFERLLAELDIELWIGDAAAIRAKRGRRKPKTDRQDAQHILHLMLKDDFPQIWVPSWENRDQRQLLWHRHRMVQARTRLMNQLQAVALNEGLRCKRRLWREKGRKQLEAIRLGPWASRRRKDLLQLLKQGSSMLRFLLVESAQMAARSIPQWRNQYFHLAMRRGRKIAKVALARKLAIRLFWMMRQAWDYEQMTKFGSHAGQPASCNGV